MENPEEVLHCLEEFTKIKPKDIPRELEDYLCFVAKTGNPVYQWPLIKCLFRQKLINVVTEFYESCPTVEIPPCLNVDLFNYNNMKMFILEKLDTFVAAPFTVQRICELLTTPRKQYNRIDKYMRALEKNILVVSTTEPGGNRRSTENGEGINGLESDHMVGDGPNNGSSDINIEEMDDSTPNWRRLHQQSTAASFSNTTSEPERTKDVTEKPAETDEVAPIVSTDKIEPSDILNKCPPGGDGSHPSDNSIAEDPVTSVTEWDQPKEPTSLNTPYIYDALEPVMDLAEKDLTESQKENNANAEPDDLNSVSTSVAVVLSETECRSESTCQSSADGVSVNPDTTTECEDGQQDINLEDDISSTKSDAPEEIATAEIGEVKIEETITVTQSTTAEDDCATSPVASDSTTETSSTDIEDRAPTTVNPVIEEVKSDELVVAQSDVLVNDVSSVSTTEVENIVIGETASTSEVNGAESQIAEPAECEQECPKIESDEAAVDSVSELPESSESNSESAELMDVDEPERMDDK